MGQRTKRARIVEAASATALAAVSGVVAFLAVPLDLAGRMPGERHGGRTVAEARAVERARAPEPALPAPLSPSAEAPAPPEPVDPFLLLLPPTRPWRHHPEEDLRLHPVAAPEVVPESGDEVGRTLFLLGAEHHAVGDYERAADYYEAFARHDPSADGAGCTDAERSAGSCPNAPAALENAMLFRRALGQVDRALDDAELYERWYAETRVEDAARVSSEAGEILEAEGAHVEAATHYRRQVRTFARHVDPGASLRMRTRLGRALWESGDRRGAARVFRYVVTRWHRGVGGLVATTPDDLDDASGTGFSRTLDAVAEAAFHLAELRLEAFRAVDRPEYEGDHSVRDVERWVATRLRPWVLRKVRALRDAREAYERVAALGVTEWQIAARARTGEMFRALMEDLASAPVPEAIGEGDEQIAGVVVPVQAWREPALAQLRGPAVGAFEQCLLTAVRTRHFGAWSRACAEELTRLAPDAHPPSVELGPGGLRIHDEVVMPRPAERGFAG